MSVSSLLTAVRYKTEPQTQESRSIHCNTATYIKKHNANKRNQNRSNKSCSPQLHKVSEFHFRLYSKIKSKGHQCKLRIIPSKLVQQYHSKENRS